MKKNKQTNEYKQLIKKALGAVDAVTDANRTKIVINPDYKIPPVVYNPLVEAKSRMFKTLFEKQISKALHYELPETARTKLELCSYEYDIPFEDLEEIFLHGAAEAENEDGGYEAVAEFIEENFENTDKLESILLFEGNVTQLSLPSAQRIKQQTKGGDDDAPPAKAKWYRIQTAHNDYNSQNHQIPAEDQDSAEKIAINDHNKSFGVKNARVLKTVYLPNGPRKNKRKVGKSNPITGAKYDDEIVVRQTSTKRKSMSKTAKKIRDLKRTIRQITDPNVSDYKSLDAIGQTGKSGEKVLNKKTRKRKPKITAANDNDDD